MSIPTLYVNTYILCPPLYLKKKTTTYSMCSSKIRYLLNSHESIFTVQNNVYSHNDSTIVSEAKSISTKLFSDRINCILKFTRHLILCNIVKKIQMFCNDWKEKRFMSKIYDIDQYRISVFSDITI